MKLPQLLPLDAPKSPVRILLLGQAVLDNVNRKFATPISEHGNTLDRFASRPEAKLMQAISRQIFPRDPGHVPLKPHDQISNRVQAEPGTIKKMTAAAGWCDGQGAG